MDGEGEVGDTEGSKHLESHPAPRENHVQLQQTRTNGHWDSESEKSWTENRLHHFLYRGQNHKTHRASSPGSGVKLRPFPALNSKRRQMLDMLLFLLSF